MYFFFGKYFPIKSCVDPKSVLIWVWKMKKGDFIMFCPNCGTNNTNGVPYCAHCGRSLSSNPVPSQPVYVAPPQQTYVVKQKSGGCLKVIGIFFAIVVVIAIVLALTLHKCDNCGDYFFGEGTKIFGYRLCDDCLRWS